MKPGADVVKVEFLNIEERTQDVTKSKENDRIEPKFEIGTAKSDDK